MALWGDVKLESTVVFGQPWVSPPVGRGVRRVVVAHVAGSKRPVGVPPGEARLSSCHPDQPEEVRKVVMALKEVNSGDMGSDISTASGSSSTVKRDEFEEALSTLEGLSLVSSRQLPRACCRTACPRCGRRRRLRMRATCFPRSRRPRVSCSAR